MMIEPRELPGHRQGREVPAPLCKGAFAVTDLQGLPLSHRNRQGGAEASAVQPITWRTIVHAAGSSAVPGTVQGEPHSWTDGVRDMCLKSRKRVLPPHGFSGKKRPVGCKEPDPAVEVKVPFLP